MSSGLLIFLEMSLVIGGTLGFALWQLASLRRERQRREQAKAAVDPLEEGEQSGSGPSA